MTDVNTGAMASGSDTLGAGANTGAGAGAGQKLSLNRVPTLTFPPLHLGSFGDLDAASFPSPPGATTPPVPDVSGRAQLQPLGQSIRSLNGRPGSRGSASERHQPQVSASISEGSGSNTRTLRPASRESTRSRGSMRSRQLSASASAPSPPPTGALPPLPTSSEHSPQSAGVGTFGAAQAAALAHITGNFAKQSSLDASTFGSAEVQDRSTTPTFRNADTERPVLRDSPIPRRRTLIQEPRERQVSMVLDDTPLVPSPLAETFPLPMAMPNGNGGVEHLAGEEGEHKLEKRASTNNLRASPTSPKKRSLPRPPADKPALEIVTALPTPVAARVQEPAQTRAAPSASTLPIIAGLADAGPYSFTKPQGPPGLGRPPPAQARQEEVCLECMMRDQDLADVDVSTPGVWGRASDVALEDLKWREESLLSSMGNVRLDTREFGTSDEESSGPSPPSTTNSLEEAEARRKEAARQRKALIKARKREVDYRVAKEVGWRGFKWEEGTAGEGLPRGFRGTKGGRLTEEGIKAVMIKFPSASALRYNNLQNYLRNQYLLVMDIAAEASRIGYFPPPLELGYDEERRDHVPPAPMYTTPIRGSSVKPSPSSPADLSAIAGSGAGRSKPAPLARPLTHYIPEREPARAPDSLRLKPTLTSLSTSPNNQYISDIDYSPISPADSGVRPFSFAVRAGATGQGMGESEGQNGRRSFFGRWGGSVTSFFGGSQGGSGSMMDMHVGLDNERRNRTSSFNVHSQPRAVSLASPTRPSFFSRDSRDSAQIERQSREVERSNRTRGQSLSTSRLSQVINKPEDEAEVEAGTPSKKKGLKGLIKRMRGKSVSAKTPPAMPYEQFSAGQATTYPRPQGTAQPPQQGRAGPHHTQSQNFNQQLAPPPPLSYLVGRGGGEKHARNRSGSSSSMMTDTSGVPYPNGNGNRSVSAPLDTSSGDQSGSPTSSKYDRDRTRDSYGSAKRSLYAQQVRYSRDDGQGQGVNGDFGAPVPSNSHPPMSGGVGGGDQYPRPIPQNPSFRSGNGAKTASSMSASSVVETPPPVHMPLTYPHHVDQKQYSSAPGFGPLPSPNRFKNLPPLPPDSGSSGRPSPNPDRDEAYGEETLRSVRTGAGPTRSNSNLPQPLYQPVGYRQGSERSPAFQEQARARASYDTGETRRFQHTQQQPHQQQRMAQSMYMPPVGQEAYGYPQHSQGRGQGQGQGYMDQQQQLRQQHPHPQQQYAEYGGQLLETTASRGKEKRKGLKGLFGGSKAGRLA